jgi:hypothetical protein
MIVISSSLALVADGCDHLTNRVVELMELPTETECISVCVRIEQTTIDADNPVSGFRDTPTIYRPW